MYKRANGSPKRSPPLMDICNITKNANALPACQGRDFGSGREEGGRGRGTGRNEGSGWRER